MWQIDEKGWIEAIRRLESPYFNERPAGTEIDLIVLHGISLPEGDFGGPHVDELFLGKLDTGEDTPFAFLDGQLLSTHLYINREGELTQYVSLFDRAWHAGVSAHQDRVECNDYSIGIELEGAEDIPYAEVQYEVLNQMIEFLAQHFPIKSGNVVGHDEVAPGRKDDPWGSFDWNKVKREGF